MLKKYNYGTMYCKVLYAFVILQCQNKKNYTIYTSIIALSNEY